MKLVRILLPIDQQGTTVACRKAAFAFAEKFGVRLEVLHLCAAPWQRLPYSTELSPFYSEDLIDIGREQVTAEQGEARKWFDKAAAANPGVKAEFLSMEGVFTPIAACRARVADVSVLPSIGAIDDAFWAAVREGALFQSARPVLVMPESEAANIGDTVIVAWKDGVEATRAVVAAAPFLADAKRIILVSVQEGEHQDPTLASMADYLALQGLASTPRRLRFRPTTPGTRCSRRRRSIKARCSSWAPMAIGVGANGCSAASPSASFPPPPCRC